MADQVKNIVLVGRSGTGKSATGNSILGQRWFKSEKSAGGVSMHCEMYSTLTQDGTKINVIDTPGLSHLSVSAEYLSREIIKCLTLAEEGLHAVLFVLSVKTRLSHDEESTFNTLTRIFEDKILDYLIVVFTGGDELEEEEVTLDDYLSDGCPEFLKRILSLCGGRKVLFDNKTTDEAKKTEQLKQLLAHVTDIEKQTGGRAYTDKMHRKIKEENDKLREQEKEIESKNLAEADSHAMKQSLEEENENTMRMMADMVEHTLTRSAEAHEIEMLQLRMQLEQHRMQLEQHMQAQQYLFPLPLKDIQPSCKIM